jgi:hypothetical protein
MANPCQKPRASGQKDFRKRQADNRPKCHPMSGISAQNRALWPSKSLVLQCPTPYLHVRSLII